MVKKEQDLTRLYLARPWGAGRGSEHVCRYMFWRVCTWQPTGLVPPGPVGHLCLPTLAAVDWGLLRNKGRLTLGCAQTAFQSLAWRAQGVVLPRDPGPLCGKFCFLSCLDSSLTHPSSGSPASASENYWAQSCTVLARILFTLREAGSNYQTHPALLQACKLRNPGD